MWAYGGRLQDEMSLHPQIVYICGPAVAFSSTVQYCTIGYRKWCTAAPQPHQNQSTRELQNATIPRHKESDRYDTNSNYNQLIFDRSTLCQNYKLVPLVHALNTLSIILLCQLLPFLTYRNSHLFYRVNFVMITANPYSDDTPEVFDGVKVWWLCRPNHT